MGVHIEAIFRRMLWPTLFDSWEDLCDEFGIQTQARHHVYTPGRIGCYASSTALEIAGADSPYDDVEMTKALAIKAVAGFAARFHGLVLSEFEGAEHVAQRMDNTDRAEITIDKDTYPADFAAAVKVMQDDPRDMKVRNELLEKVCKKAATKHVNRWCAYLKFTKETRDMRWW
jgi:hypothetical protein